MGQLATDHKVFVAFPMVSMGLSQPFQQLSDALAIGRNQNQLVRIRSAVWADGHRFSTPNQFSSRFTEPLPTANHRLGDPATGRSIPSFHRLHCDSIANRAMFPMKRTQEWAACGIVHMVIQRDLYTESMHMLSKKIG
jgi:hypothetical protein